MWKSGQHPNQLSLLLLLLLLPPPLSQANGMARSQSLRWSWWRGDDRDENVVVTTTAH